MTGAVLDQINAPLLKNNLALNLGETMGAETVSEGIKEIGASRHRD